MKKFFINVRYKTGYWYLCLIRKLLTAGYKATCRARNTKLRTVFLKISIQWVAVTEKIHWHLVKWDKALEG